MSLEKLVRLLTVFAELTNKLFSHLTISTIDIISVCNSLPCPIDGTPVVVFIFSGPFSALLNQKNI